MLTDDRVEWYLEQWQRWMDESNSPGKYSKRASGGVEGYRSMDREGDSAYDDMCRRCGEAVQAVLDGLPRALRLAVYVRHGISNEKALMAAALYVNGGDPDENYREACGILAVQLAARGMC